MTPLPRWVLLALLLATVAAHPVHHACVHLCHAQNTIPKLARVCEDQQKLVLQSVGGRFPTQRLFRLCLTPCHGAPSDSHIFDASETCRNFRKSLIQRQGCSCLINDGIQRRLETTNVVEQISRDLLTMKLKGVDVSKMLKKMNEEAVAPADVRQRLDSNYRSEYIMESVEEGKGAAKEVNDFEDAPTDHSNSESTGEPSVDWDLWCMAQCNNGKGGSACECDIIP